MLGLRGCRLGITLPEITEMQARAIFEAAVIAKKAGQRPTSEVMIPLVGGVEEMKNQGDIVRWVAKEVFKEKGVKVDFMVGTMIELPRAALTADQIAEEAEFFSYGTNDLTQTTYGISRDDINNFLPTYLQQGIFKRYRFSRSTSVELDSCRDGNQEGTGDTFEPQGRHLRRTRWRSRECEVLPSDRT